MAKHYARQHILPRDVVISHERGEIHYHDLDSHRSSRCLTAC
ncbi:anaerobic ribonucleoside-triphosphate reductase [Shigella flexneri]